MANEMIEILKLLISNREEDLSIRKISQLRNINYKSAYIALKKLNMEQLVSLQRIGNTIKCSFNNQFNDLVFRAEWLRKKELFRKKDFLVIYQRLAELPFFFIALLFGSHAKGTSQKHSDIDILTIGGKKEAISAALSILPYKIHLTAIDSAEFIHMAKSKEFTVASEAMKKNVIFIGIEDYYRLLNHAQ